MNASAASCLSLTTQVHFGLQISSEIDSLQLQRDKVNEFINKNYKIVISNVDHLDEAQIICFGDDHENERHRKINASIIDMLYIEKSIVLIEDSHREAEENLYTHINNDYDHQAKYVESPVKIDGWDIDLELNSARMKEMDEHVKSEIIYEKPEVFHFLDDKTIKLAHDVTDKRVSSCSLRAFSYFCKICCISLFIKSCKLCIKKHYKNKVRYFWQKTVNEVPARNVKMCLTAEQALLAHEKVFVLAGLNHFIPVQRGLEGVDYEPSNTSARKTIDFLARYRFAILIPLNIKD